jgi:hypothetical protein
MVAAIDSIQSVAEGSCKSADLCESKILGRLESLEQATSWFSSVRLTLHKTVSSLPSQGTWQQ